MKYFFLFLLFVIRSLFDPIFRFQEVSILAYHSISDDPADTAVSAASFTRQLEKLKRGGYAFVPLADVVEWYEGKKELPRRAVAITFDDGYADFETTALPILEKFNAPATLFIVGNREGYRAKLGTVLPMLGGDQVERLKTNPLVEIGYHTNTHPDVRTLSPLELRNECLNPVPTRYFAYPGGNYSDDALRILAELGYQAAFSIKPELVQRSQNRFLLPRIVVTKHMSDWELSALTSRASTWYRSVRRTLRYG